jgi:hypothetical protein
MAKIWGLSSIRICSKSATAARTLTSDDAPHGGDLLLQRRIFRNRFFAGVSMQVAHQML